ncbi:hypothetical protein WICANDRAFT_79863 [Wickerhamomyces anomalus NRRL Y-366-8]|uniref:Zn(2)-C6 fungal-type domain-containing protein n=1 Tax=Wickerhamomyces anomalus (strain ATCC 58044 / CBS 1984 / NCYC 433 / NRRL Y-366-8) TaxID=683960 RepID=A0A1E3P1Q9_WICAA|nr:uncharacterized protein WICANDRAFT_79863 [Wickerhamomyces anomalus NRRL Y-366-8]ODQ59345.1 hypothetical protein WICANDRAFT_79863 [Wickerhamomyces anomalus NRRL Y-366-8]
MAKKQIPIQPKSLNNNTGAGHRVTKLPTSASGQRSNSSTSSILSSSALNSPLSTTSSSSSSPIQNNAALLEPMISNSVFNLPLIPESTLPKPKILKSCIRCRKHKTKCDASEKTPNPCSSCAKKGIQCKIDYVLPPQRSDNLKNLVGQVETIKTNYELLEDYYTKISNRLNIKIESFEEWKLQNAQSTRDELIDNNNEEEDSEQKSSYNLIKLSDGSFISMNLVEDNQLLINNKLIQIDQFQEKLNKLSKRLTYLFQATLSQTKQQTDPSTPDNNSSTDDNSSIASPISAIDQEIINDVCQFDTGITLPQNNNIMQFLITPENHLATPPSSSVEILPDFKLFDLKFSVLDLFKDNKFLLILLVGFFYPDAYNSINSLNYNLFLSDYLNSYYQIMENQNKALNSSTYSSFLINSINPSYQLTFNKDQLKDLIDCEIFNSELYLKKIIQILFLNVLIYGLDEHFKILKDFIQFVKININSNRKKINFEKNVDLKFIDHYIKLFETFGESSEESTATTAVSSNSPIENFKQLLNFNLSFTNDYQLKKNQSLFNQTISNPSNDSLNSLKGCFKKFISNWSNYFQFYESELGLFIDDFIIEIFIINCLIFINEGHQDFNSILLDCLTSFKINNNESICELIEFFKTSKDELIQPNIEHFNFSCFQSQHIIMNLILNKKNSIDPKMNDIQMILENVDWKKETPDDVLKKIGVI